MQTSKQRIAIVGGGYAGMLAAARIGPAADVTLIDAQPGFAQRIRFHEALAGSRLKTFAYGPALARRGVKFVQGFVEALDPAAGRVSGRAAEGGRLDLGYDTLILALGSTTPAPLPGLAEHALRLNDAATIGAAAARLRSLAGRGGRALIIGGGLTGLETATELAERYPGLRVTLALGGRPGGYAPRALEHLERTLERLGIAVREDATVVAVEAGQAWCADGSALPFDLCVWAGGFVAPPLARAAGLAVDALGRALVDAHLRVPGQPNIIVAGDAAAVSQGDQTIRMGCASAMPMGAYAGDSVVRQIKGQPLEAFSFGFVARCISLGRGEALLQFTHPDDRPRDASWAGRRAVYTKEAICRLTLTIVRNELRTGLRLYRWAASN